MKVWEILLKIFVIAQIKMHNRNSINCSLGYTNYNLYNKNHMLYIKYRQEDVFFMITDTNYYKKVGKRLFTVIFTILALYIIFKLSMFYIPFLIAFIISLIIEPLIKKIMRITNLTRKISAIITLIIVFGLIIGLLVWGVTVLITETTTILDNINNNMETIESGILSLMSSFNFDDIKVPEQIKVVIQNSANVFAGEGRNVVQKLLSNIINIAKNIPKIMIYVGITIVATYFVCADKMYILDQMEHHLPRNWVNKFRV